MTMKLIMTIMTTFLSKQLRFSIPFFFFFQVSCDVTGLLVMKRTPFGSDDEIYLRIFIPKYTTAIFEISSGADGRGNGSRC